MLQLEILAQGWRRRGATQLTQQSIHLQEPPFKAYCTVWMCKQLNSLVSRNNSIPYPSLTPSSKAYYAPLSHLKVKCKNSHKGLTTRWFSHTLSELTFKFPNEWRIILFCRASSHQEKRKARPPICSNHTDRPRPSSRSFAPSCSGQYSLPRLQWHPRDMGKVSL